MKKKLQHGYDKRTTGNLIDTVVLAESKKILNKHKKIHLSDA